MRKYLKRIACDFTINTKYYRRSFVLALCVGLSACMVGPNYKEPKTVTPKHWKNTDKHVKETPFKQVKWWESFHDDNLTCLIYQGYYHNLSLHAAGVHVLQARAQLAKAVGNLYPQQQALTGSLDYYRIGGGYLQDVLPSSFNTATVGVLSNWEIDFWGKYRRAIKSSDAAFLASLAAYDNALVTLTADIANTYIQYRTTESLIKVTNENIKVQKMSLKLTQSRFNAGEVSMLDVEQAKTELAETQAKLPTLISNLQQEKDALSLLLGMPPNEIDPMLKSNYGIPKAPRQVETGIPKETLARRPDIHQARLEAIAQSETIGAVKAMLYPALSLSGNFAFSSNTITNNSLGELFNWSSLNVIAGPAFNWPILNYGQITNAVRAQDSIFQQSLLNYLNLVLSAQKEVQDNITRFVESKKSEKLLSSAVHSAIKATNLTIIQYKEGEDDFTTVLYAEQQQLRVQTELVNAQAEVPLALVALYRALGGGWQIRNGDDIVPLKIREDMARRTNWGNLLKQPNHQAPRTKKQEIEQLYEPSF